MSPKNKIQLTKKRNKVKRNGQKSCKFKVSDTITADKEIIDLDTSSSSLNSSDNISLNNSRLTLSQLKVSDTMTANTEIIELDTSSSTTNTTNNICLNNDGLNLCQLKISDTMTANTEIIDLDTSSMTTNTEIIDLDTSSMTTNTEIIDLNTSSSSWDTTDNISLDNSIPQSSKSLEQPLTPIINIENQVPNEKGVLMLSKLPEPFSFMPNSAIMSVLSGDKTPEYLLIENILNRVQCELESLMSYIFELKNSIKDNFQSLSSIKLADYKQYGIPINSKLSVRKSKSIMNSLPINEHNVAQDQNDSCSESSLESAEEISKSDEVFWNYVKPYLAHVSKHDLKWLKRVIMSYDKKLPKIPPLNEHYTKVWTREKLKTQKNQPSDHTQLDKSIQRITPDVIEVLSKVNHAIQNGSEFTPMFQKVVSALREHIHTIKNDNSKENIEYECVEDNLQDMSNYCKQFYKEKNVKNQLVNLGLAGHYSKPVLPPLISECDTDVDEILEELTQCDITLNKLQKVNKHDLMNLFKKVTVDKHKQKIKSKIDKINRKILKFKKRSNKNLKRKNNSLIAKENGQLRLLLNKRNDYLLELSEFMNNEIPDPSL